MMTEESLKFEHKVAKKYLSTLNSANSRNKEFKLALSDIRKLLKTKKCYFTGNVMNEIHDDPNQRTIDRLDNDKGYIKGNVVACTKEINKLKGELTLKQLKQLFNGLKKSKLL